ncbi:MAG: endonuclease V [Nitrososphaeraceae archaeon]
MLPSSVIYYALPRLQEVIAYRVVQSGECTPVKYICGIDVSYKGDLAFGTAVIMDSTSFDTIEVAESVTPIKFPYIPGAFILREAGPILHTMRLLTCDFDVLLLDGHGMLHPRKCGLASFVGVLIDKPTIGIAKKLLCGEVNSEYFVEIDRIICGYMHVSALNKRIYISVGNRISLRDSIKLVRKLTREGQSIPEPLRVADLYSKYHCKLFFRN